MANTVLIVLGLICLIIWNVVGFYAAYTTIRDDRRKEFERKMEEREELERKIRRQIRDEIWLEEQSRKLRQEELKKKFEEIAEVMTKGRRVHPAARISDGDIVMERIEIDIETFSSTDLSKAGVYKYSESDDFGILLFAYSMDGGEVIVCRLHGRR
jgi:hypothetical protein